MSKAQSIQNTENKEKNLWQLLKLKLIIKKSASSSERQVLFHYW